MREALSLMRYIFATTIPKSLPRQTDIQTETDRQTHTRTDVNSQGPSSIAGGLKINC